MPDDPAWVDVAIVARSPHEYCVHLRGNPTVLDAYSSIRASRLGGGAACGRTVVPTPTDADGEETVAILGTLSVTVTVTRGADAQASSAGPAAAEATDASVAADVADALSYSLIDDAAGRFAIDAKTGVIHVKDAGCFSRDEADAHMIVVRATDGRGAFFERRVLVPMIDIRADAAARHDRGRRRA